MELYFNNRKKKAEAADSQSITERKETVEFS